ncbi:MAG: OmpA family protein [Chitinophagaceae bacterium]|nr:OmpA family protein [Chitinophagaceae bacterium]
MLFETNNAGRSANITGQQNAAQRNLQQTARPAAPPPATATRNTAARQGIGQRPVPTTPRSTAAANARVMQAIGQRSVPQGRPSAAGGTIPRPPIRPGTAQPGRPTGAGIRGTMPRPPIRPGIAPGRPPVAGSRGIVPPPPGRPGRVQPGRPAGTQGGGVTGWRGNRNPSTQGAGFNAGFDVSVSPLWPGNASSPQNPPAPGQPNSCNCGGSTSGPVIPPPPPLFPPRPPLFPPAPPVNPGTRPGSSTGTCVQCGNNANGCATISRFAFNSSDLTSQHTQQIAQVAREIFDKKINSVLATGHADSRGTEQYNDNLGYERAVAVIREIRNQLNTIQPNFHRLVYWRIDSAGETLPLANNTDDANNRRVEVCLKIANI